MHKFTELNVYRKAIVFTRDVRKITREFPREELFVLSAQFRRAADSIPLNIAEGAGNSSTREFSRFLDYSVRSGFECIGCCDIARENAFLDQPSHSNLVAQANEIIAMLNGLKRSLNR